MKLQMTFRNLDRSDAARRQVERHMEKLTTFCDRITSCRVAIEAPHRHHHLGSAYRVRIDLAVPGGELVVSSIGGTVSADLHAAIDTAFDQAKRQVKDYTRRQRGVVKSHHLPTLVAGRR